MMAVPSLTPRDVEDLLHGIQGKRVLVVGDVLLDVFAWGHVERVCPEAPVPVVLERETSYRVSGAALAVPTLRSLGAGVQVLTVVGHDDDGARVRQMLEAQGAALTLIPAADRPTPRKTRVMAAHPSAARTPSIDGGPGWQQLLRLDREATTDVEPRTEEALIAAARGVIGAADCVLISDYAKGVCTKTVTRAVIDAAGARGIPVVVDPKRGQPEHYRGATVLTPNPHELAALTAEPDAHGIDRDRARALAERLRRAAAASWVVATRDADGLIVVGPPNPPNPAGPAGCGGTPEADAAVVVPAYAERVVDVAGAGDVLAGVLAAALAAHPSPPTLPRMTRAAVLASLAAGLSLRHRDHKRVTPGDLLHAARQHGITAGAAGPPGRPRDVGGVRPDGRASTQPDGRASTAGQVPAW